MPPALSYGFSRPPGSAKEVLGYGAPAAREPVTRSVECNCTAILSLYIPKSLVSQRFSGLDALAAAQYMLPFSKGFSDREVPISTSFQRFGSDCVGKRAGAGWGRVVPATEVGRRQVTPGVVLSIGTIRKEPAAR